MATKPLKGKRIVLTRSARGNYAWKKYFADLGATVYTFTTIRTEPVKPTPEIVKALRNLSDFDWIIFTSAAGLRAMRVIAKAAAIDISPSRVPPLTVIGPATAAAARKMGYAIAFSPTVSNEATLAGEFKSLHGRSILLLRTDIASPVFSQMLQASGAKVADISIYRTSLEEGRDVAFEKLIVDKKIDFLIFASPSAVRGFCDRISGEVMLREAKKIPAIAFGAFVKKALIDAGFKKIRVTSASTREAVSAALS